MSRQPATPNVTPATLHGMGILEGKKLVITGVLTDASLAYGVAKIALEEGAEIVLTGAGRALSLTKRTARKLGQHNGADIPVFEFDVTVAEHVESGRCEVADLRGTVDGGVAAIGLAPAAGHGAD
jgi:enoyl-[acyl-carrier protein] reductase I